MTSVMQSVIQDICRNQLNTGIRRYRQISDGNSKETWRVDTEAEGTVYIHVGDDRLRDEAAVLQWVDEHTPLPVPELSAVGSARNNTFFVTREATGHRLTEHITRVTQSVQHDLVYSIGAFLAHLHNSIEFEGNGPVTRTSNGLQVTKPTDGREYFRTRFKFNRQRLPTAFDATLPTETTSLPWSAIPDNSKGRLYHWDFRPGNMLYEDGSISAILDWGDPQASRPALGFAKVVYISLDWFGLSHFLPHLRSGYESVRPIHWDQTEYLLARIVAIVQSAVDANGAITRPGHPQVSETEALVFHQEQISNTMISLYEQIENNQ